VSESQEVGEPFVVQWDETYQQWAVLSYLGSMTHTEGNQPARFADRSEADAFAKRLCDRWRTNLEAYRPA
jgi:hypothetical protein